MIAVMRSSWALLLGMFLLMLGNGMQGTLLGVRGAIEGFDPGVLSYVISAYFVGFLGGSWLAPAMIRRVGHVRVFAAMGSMISAAFVLYAAAPDLVAWGLLRLVVGFCFSCVYVVAESWLNDAADNRNRGKALSLYVIVQMVGIVAAQALMNLGDPAGYGLFVLISVLVSVSFAPILLTVSPAPVHDMARPMTLRQLFRTSPLGFVGAAAIGAAFAALFGMASVYGTETGLSLAQIATFVSAFYVGGMLFQFPIGWLSDRMDRRVLIVAVTALCCAACFVAIFTEDNFALMVAMAVVIGGMINPLYSLMIAHTNDFLAPEDMAAAASGLVFVGGVGAIAGPVVVGQMMQHLGPWSFYLYILAIMGGVSLYGLYRMTRRPTASTDETSPHAVYAPGASPAMVDFGQEYVVERMIAEDDGAENIREAAQEKAESTIP